MNNKLLSVNIARGKKFYSALNKPKRSLLSILSFNTISADNTRQFDKQAINKTEDSINGKANKFLNKLGAGRSEIGIGGITSGENHVNRCNTIGHESSPSTTRTPATVITPKNDNFIMGSASHYGWTSAELTGEDRVSAWADGGANDICPAGFSVPTIVELEDEANTGTTRLIIDTASAFLNRLNFPSTGTHLILIPPPKCG